MIRYTTSVWFRKWDLDELLSSMVKEKFALFAKLCSLLSYFKCFAAFYFTFNYLSNEYNLVDEWCEKGVHRLRPPQRKFIYQYQ